MFRLSFRRMQNLIRQVFGRTLHEYSRLVVQYRERILQDSGEEYDKCRHYPSIPEVVEVCSLSVMLCRWTNAEDDRCHIVLDHPGAESENRVEELVEQSVERQASIGLQE